MSSSRRNSKQISPENESTMQSVKSPEMPKIRIKLKQPEQESLSENDVKKMFLAIEENDVKSMRTYLAQRNVHPDTLFETNVFEESTFTWSALHAAAYYGSKQIINLLMEFNANVELQDTWYQGRPLAWAAFGGHLDTAKLLIEKYNADTKAKNEHGQVALDLVYEQTPEWEKVFAQNGHGARSAKTTKNKKNGDEIAKSHHKDTKGSKDGREGKNIVTIPGSPTVAAFTELYKLILNHKDKTGRELADVFLALPSKEEYPEYYDIIKSPMSLQLVLARIKSGHYKTVEDFDREFQLIFENALFFNEDTSRINKDAKVLLKLFNTRKTDVYASYGLVEHPKASAIDKSDRQKVTSHTKDGITYQAGEFVEMTDPAKTILLIERLEVDSKKNKFIAGSRFLRPEQTLQVPGQTFYEKEVLKASGEWEYDFSLVDRKVYVQAHKDYVRGLVLNFDPSDVYLFENRYSETGKSAFLIKDWRRVYSVDPLPTPVRAYPSPIKLPKFEVKSAVTADSTRDTVGQYNGRRPSSAHSDSNKNKRSRSIKKPKPSKRRQSQSNNDSDDDDEGEEDEEDEEEDGDVDVDGISSSAQTSSQRRRSSQLQRQQAQAQLQQPHQQHQQQQQQQLQYAQQLQQQQQQNHSRRVSSQMSNNPNLMLQQQQQQQLLMQQQQQQHLYQQQQAMQFQQMQQSHGQHPMQPGIPQSPSSSQSMSSPGSPGRMSMQSPMIDPRTGLMVPGGTPLTFTPVEASTVFDPNIGQRKGHAMLQSIKMDSEDKSFMMTLGTETYAHCINVHHQVSTMNLFPALAPQLAPIQNQVMITVFLNGRKISPTPLVALSAYPTTGHHAYTIPLLPGQNAIDIWISAQTGALFQGGGSGGKTETQQFFVFVQRNSV